LVLVLDKQVLNPSMLQLHTTDGFANCDSKERNRSGKKWHECTCVDSLTVWRLWASTLEVRQALLAVSHSSWQTTSTEHDRYVGAVPYPPAVPEPLIGLFYVAVPTLSSSL